MNKNQNKLLTMGMELWKYRDLLIQLVSRDIKLKYRRSFLGYVWSVLNPLLIMLVMTVVFSAMFSRNIENFPVYLFCGQLLFNSMNTTTHNAIDSINGNAALLKKTYVPKFLFTVSKITSGMVDLLFSLGALVIVMIATGARFSWYNLLFPLVIVQLYLFCVGLGLFLSQANVFFRDIKYIYNAVTTAWMYVSCIFYPIESLSDQLAWLVRHCNPMYFYISQFRSIIYLGVAPDSYSVIAGWAVALGAMLLGIWCFSKSEDKFILYI